MPRDWGIGDWLINYQAGFVRRGLPGEFIFHLSHLARLSPTWIVLFFQMFFYAILFVAVWKLLLRSSWSPWILALVLSPATFQFPVLDPSFGYRKEEIYLAGISLVLLAFLRPLAPPPRLIVVLLTVFCVVAVLSHEGILFYLPYLAAALAIALGSVPRALRLLAAPAAFALAAALLVAHYPGTASTAQGICHSLHYGDRCPDSILYLGQNKQTAVSDVSDAIRIFNYRFVYGRGAVCALIPVLLGFGSLWPIRHLHRDLLVIATSAILSILGSLVLFHFGSDWGRWIYVHIFCLFLLLLFVDVRRQADPSTAQPIRRLSLSQASLFGLVMLAYMSFWQLGAYSPRFPFGGFFHFVYQLVQTAPAAASSSALPPA